MDGKCTTSYFHQVHGIEEIFKTAAAIIKANIELLIELLWHWCKMIHDTSSIQLSSPPGCPRIIRTKAAIEKLIVLVFRERVFSEYSETIWVFVPTKSYEGLVDHARYIREVLPITLEYGAQVYGNQWTFQQDGAKPHIHYLTQQWCRDNFRAFIDKDHWPPNSPDLNPLDYSILDEFARVIHWDKVE
ncbi:unnamed protein product, partial [Adineta ricciae]